MFFAPNKCVLDTARRNSRIPPHRVGLHRLCFLLRLPPNMPALPSIQPPPTWHRPRRAAAHQMDSDSDVPIAGSARLQRPLTASKPAESPALAARARRPAGGSSGSESELDLVSAAKAFRRPSQEQRPSPAKQAEPAAARQGGGTHRGEARRASAGRASSPVQGEADSDSDSGFDLIRAARAQHSHVPSSPPAPAAASSPSSNAAAAHGRTASAAAGRGSTRHAATASLGSAPAPVPASSRYSRSELGRPARQHSPSAQAAAPSPSSLPAPHPAEAAAGLVEPGGLKASGSTPQLHTAIPHAEGRPEVRPGVMPQGSAQELQLQSSALLQASLSRITVLTAPEPSSEAFNALHVNPVFLEDILAAEVGPPAAAYVELSWACTRACLQRACTVQTDEATPQVPVFFLAGGGASCNCGTACGVTSRRQRVQPGRAGPGRRLGCGSGCSCGAAHQPGQ